MARTSPEIESHGIHLRCTLAAAGVIFGAIDQGPSQTVRRLVWAALNADMLSESSAFSKEALRTAIVAGATCEFFTVNLSRLEFCLTESAIFFQLRRARQVSFPRQKR